jgi:hypothetical protein
LCLVRTTLSSTFDLFEGEASGGMSRDECIDNTAADILKRIPTQYDTAKVWKKFGGEMISPTSVVLLQELDRFNRLTWSMSNSLTTLRRALKGEVGMSNELDDLSRALYNGQLPPTWRTLAPATKKNLANWMDHFLRRNQLYNGWVFSVSITLVLIERVKSFCLTRSTMASPMLFGYQVYTFLNHI